MGDPQNHTWWEEIIQAFGKGIVWFFYITIGVLAKLAFDSRNNKLTRKQIIVKSVLSIFCGYLSAVLCENFNYTQWAKIVVPVSTLLGEGIVLYIMTNWKKFVNKFLPPFLQSGKENDKV
jgi:hypothetical protein